MSVKLKITLAICCLTLLFWNIFSSFHELIQSRGVRRPSVCKLLRKSLLLLAGKWPDLHQTCTWRTPGQRASRMCSRSRSRSKVTWYGNFCAGTKIACSPCQIARSPPKLQSMVSRKAWPKFWVRLSRGTVIRRQSAIVPLDTQLASSYSHLQTLFRQYVPFCHNLCVTDRQTTDRRDDSLWQ